MEYQIAVTLKDAGRWEQEMTCEFPNKAIAKLVLEGAGIVRIWGEAHILREGKGWREDRIAAKLILDGNTITVYCRFGVCAWDNDQEANKKRLEELAQQWQAEEDRWLPIHRYLSVAVAPVLEKMAANVDDIQKRWEKESKARGKNSFAVTELKYDVKSNAEAIEGFKEAITDFGDCLDMDEGRMRRIEDAIQEHTARILAHFPSVGKAIEFPRERNDDRDQENNRP